MKILQIISSLDAGGAERMAVNYANALVPRIAESGLVATRSEGPLAKDVTVGVSYFRLQKRSALDVRAILALRGICKSREIDILHAHADSFFIAILVKLLHPRIKVVWHDHYGLSEFLDKRRAGVLKLASFFFHGIISVNSILKSWAEEKLHCARVIYLPNFSLQAPSELVETSLEGGPGPKVLCLANLRPQKNHPFLIEVAKRVVKGNPTCTFHLVGQDFEDEYSFRLRESIAQAGLTGNVFVYGTRRDVSNIIRQADVAILTSSSEGLPVSLLEYGVHAKPVVVTPVGEIPHIVRDGENGFLVDCGDAELFEKRIGLLISDRTVADRMGNGLRDTITERYSEDAVLRTYLEWLIVDRNAVG